MRFTSFYLCMFLSSILCVLEVRSYAIDDSCRNYKGNDISGDVQQAINEVQDMARNAYVQITRKEPNTSTIHLLQALFGMNATKYSVVGRYLSAFPHFYRTDDFVVICNDLTVKLEPDTFTSNLDPRGVWKDDVHEWWMFYDKYFPCDPGRKPHNDNNRPSAFTADERLIYVCPSILDLPQGRVLAGYKDRILDGESIHYYVLLPVILFHELYHSHVVFPALTDQKVRIFPPLNEITEKSNPSLRPMVYNPDYLNSLPTTTAYGFPYCHKLALDDPDRAVQNPDSLAFLALGLYLHRNDWGYFNQYGISVGIDFP